jgi:uncharacterized protein (DUF924 family)
MVHTKQNQVLNFWFGDDRLKSAENMERWFSKDKSFDAEIKSQFGAMVEEASNGGFDHWGKTAQGALALVILLDQFRRNIYRESAEAFSHDSHARRIAETAIEKGLDQELNPIERCFLYLPLEHAEDLSAQNRSVELFTKLAEEVSGADEEDVFKTTLDYALRHREIIERFGRFPHRNDVLGRTPTDRETEFLKTPNSAF